MYAFLTVVISKKEVAECDVSSTLRTLNRLLESPKIARSYRERVDIAFDGYDHCGEELYEIPEVRNYVYQLDESFPYWLYFLSKQHTGLHALLFCFLPPFLTEEAQARTYPVEINDLLTRRWFPALNHVGEFVGMSDKENEDLTERTFKYISNGPFPLGDR